MTTKQKSVLIGMILGDAYLQKTGKQNARLRLEHSIKQRAYLEWKVSLLENYFQAKIQSLERFNTFWKRTYNYVRIQSMSSPEFGKLQRIFYKDSKKIIPKNINTFLKSPLSLAVWFMDDGYYYPRDKMSYLYIPNFDKESIENLLFCFKNNFNLFPILKQKKKGLFLIFNVSETQKLMQIVKEHVIKSMRYKIPLDPVSTEQNSYVQHKKSSEMAIKPSHAVLPS
jgi:hypothetical protein